MPEIKHNFTGGKMNKDVDQRLVPKGEYRDAMNIQVSTSEGSDVGTVQNILGNQPGCMGVNINSIVSGSTTVGSVTDERTDSLYWFVSGGQPELSASAPMRDSIWRKSATGDCQPVFVDNYGISLKNPQDNTFNSSSLTNITSSIFDEIEVGWTVVGVTNNGTFSNTATISSFNTSPYIPFDWGFTPTTSTTSVITGVALHPMINVASGISVVMVNDGLGNFIQSNSNQVFLHGWSGGAVSQLAGDTIEIPAYSGNTYVINAAVIATLTYTISLPSSTPSQVTVDLVMLTLDANLIPFSNPAMSTSQPVNMVSPGSGLASQYNGSPITALITSLDQVTTDVANGEIIFNIADYDVTNAMPGEIVTITNYSSGYQNVLDFCVKSTNTSNNSITLEDCQTGIIAPQGFQVGGMIYGQPQPTGGAIQFPVDGVIELDQPLNLMANFQTLYFQGPRTLNFNHNNLITGIDIIDDMLFWTDNKTEPKKINIERSIAGTNSGGETHTRVINPAQGLGWGVQVMAREKHITVIRKSPIKALSLELSDGRDPSLNYAAITITSDYTGSTSIISSSNPATTTDFSELQIEDTIQISFPYDNNLNNSFNVAWAPGDYLLLREEIDSTTLPTLPLTTWTIRGKILDVSGNNFDSSSGAVVVTIEIVGLNGIPPEPDPGGILTFLADLEYSDARIFQDKFPRFSYRYKYSDGEYSTFAPWSEPAFIPTSFNYDPKKGWNTGMRNNLQSLKLKGFNTLMHADVISIDILYKDDSSTNVHLVQTIGPVDILTSGQVTRPWFSNEYTVNSQNIKSVIPSGQLLRAWDGVPRKALAQSISGNRVIYGNYEQNYDLLIGGEVYIPDFNNSLVAWAPTTVGSPQKSIKSLRDYKLGVVFTDKYGRETPVLIGESGGFNIKKTESKSYNRLTASLNGVAPSEMAYYKFYIKETSSEYYNVPMDRWYSAEDGNIWLSLPSADRNKIDLDTFLYFKKGESGDENVIENSTEYKVLDIDNEAPKWIKTKKIRIGSVRHNVGANSCLFGIAGDTMYLAPRVGEISFNLNYSGAANTVFESLPFKTSTLAHLENIQEQLYIQFVYGNDYSSQYAIAEITSDFDTSNNTADNYFISLTKPLDNDINIIFDNPAGASAINEDVRVVFSKELVENTPHFDGRFFVKIENDGKIQSMVSGNTQGINYQVKTSRLVYMFNGDGGGDFGLHMHAFTRSSTNSNYVTQDWCGSVTNGCGNSSSWSQYGTTSSAYPGELDNPGGDNYMHAAVRRSFTRDLSGATMDLYGYSSENGASGVFFINKSARGWSKRNTTGCDDDVLSWPDNNNMNHLSPACNNIDDPGCNADWKDDFSGISSNGKYINIGFAGIKAPGSNTLRSKFNGYYSGGTGSFYLSNVASFFGVGTTNDNHNDPVTKKFVEGFVAGSKFKWAEDPTETVYTIVDQTNCSYDVRFGRHSDGLRNHSKNLISDPSSYSKNWGFHTDKPLVWNPSSDDTFIDGGLHLGDATGPADFIRNVTTDSGLTLTLADTSGIQVGMAVRHANIPLDCNVTAVIGNQVMISSPSTGSGVGGVDVSFGFIIRVKGGSIYGVTIDGSTGINPQENYLLVDRITTLCSNGNNLKPMYGLQPGMALDFCNSDPDDTFFGVCIKSVGLKDSNGHYRIDLGGRFYPLHAQSNVFTFALGGASNDIVLNKALAVKQVPMNGASNFSEANTDDSLNDYPMTPPSVSGPLGPIVAVGYTLQFLEEFDTYTDGNSMPQDPFIWETKPKQSEGIDVYHEISDRYAIELNPSTILQVIPLGSQVTSVLDEGAMDIMQPFVYAVGGPGGDEITIQTSVTGGIPGAWAGPGQTNTGTNPIVPGSTLIITKPNGELFNVVVKEVMDQTAFGPGYISNKFRLQKNLYSSEHTLNWHNCYSFGNGVESNRAKDVYNANFMGNGVKVSAIFEEYAKERRSYGLVYSGIYNSTSGVNNLNQFSYAEKITKDINPIYGSIQKLYAGWGQGGDLIALCEDRVLKILADKDALYNADGNSNVTSTNSVLGQAIPYSGEYGISKNPESFASEAYRAYFTDKVRGTVMRLSVDGLTPISDHGMKDWFRDHLKLGDKLIGSYDDKKDEYNITIKGNTIAKTVTFREDVKGWVSFKSFTPENAISCANEYYTFKNGNIWKHHNEFVNRNTFYGVGPANQDPNTYSSVEVIFNEMPGSVKSFKTVNYEGSQAKVTSKDENGVTLMDGEYFNLADVDGWHVIAKNGVQGGVVTNLERGGVTEFIKKEGKWFGYVIGDDVSVSSLGNISDTSNYDTEDFSIQGIGSTVNVVSSITFGCMDDGGSTNLDVFGDGSNVVGIFDNPSVPGVAAFNYISAATNDNGSCIDVVMGCIDPIASNTDNNANTDNGSCLYPGCTTPLADVFNETSGGGSLNFDPNANYDDGSCVIATYGCTLAGFTNTNTYADFGSSILQVAGTSCASTNCMCIPFIYGCTDGITPATNFLTLVDELTDVNTDNGSCIYSGCTDPLAENYDPMFSGSTVDGPNGSLTYLNGNAHDDGSCTYNGGCTDATACNYDATATLDDGSCYFCGDSAAVNYDAATPDYICTGTCAFCEDVASVTIYSQTTAAFGMSDGTITIEWPASTSSSVTSYEIYGAGITTATITPSGNLTETHTITGLGTGTYTIYVSTLCTSDNGGSLLAGYHLPGGNMGAGTNFGTPVSITITTTATIGCIDDGSTYTSGAVNPAGGTWGACNLDLLANADASGVIGGTDYSNCNYTDCVGCNNQFYVEYCGDCWDSVNFVNGPPGSSYGQWVSDTVPTSCITLIVSGCTDATAFNYDSTNPPNADCAGVFGGTDTSCCQPVVNGCMDDTLNNDGSYAASNYSGPPVGSANTDDGSCIDYNCPYDLNITENGVSFSFKVLNFTTPYAFSDITRTATIGGVVVTSFSNQSSVYNAGVFTGRRFYEPIADYITAGDTSIVVGFNVTTTDGNCDVDATTKTFTIGCADNAANNATGFDISDNTQCTYSGCTDATACNFDFPADSTHTDDGSCYFCGDTNAYNYDGNGATSWNCNANCTYAGCTDNTPTTMDASVIAATNYNPTATIPCNTSDPLQGYTGPLDTTLDNGCCTYDNQVSNSYVIHNSSENFNIYYEPEDSAYTTAEFTTITIGDQNNGVFNTLTNVYSQSNMGPGATSRLVYNWELSDWQPYIYNNNVRVGGTWIADGGNIDNAYLGNVLPPTTDNVVYNFSVGCKNDSTAVNYNANLDLHLDGSCVAVNPGCMDINAWATVPSNNTATAAGLNGYDAAHNTACGTSGSTTDTSCCCFDTACDVFAALGATSYNSTTKELTIPITLIPCARNYQYATRFYDGGWSGWTAVTDVPATQTTLGSIKEQVSVLWPSHYANNAVDKQIRVRAVCTDADPISNSPYSQATVTYTY